jgi:hypothetical protein
VVDSVAADPSASETTDFLRTSPYERWIAAQGIPIHTGYYVEDLRTIEVRWWEARGCLSAFTRMNGQEGVTEARVTEIPPGETTRPFRFALDEAVYVLEGRGLASIWATESTPKKTFEWHEHSLFLIPGGYHCQLFNSQGERRVRLLQYNHFPLALSTIPDPDFFLNNPYVDLGRLADGGDFYGAAKPISEVAGSAPWRWETGSTSGAIYAYTNIWFGNLFPDLKAWDKFQAYRGRGGGTRAVSINFPGSALSSHMSIFPSGTYKKAHRHGPGIIVVIVDGEGYSVMWPEGSEKTVVPWHAGSAFSPPNRWFHQHFNVGARPARYMALHVPHGLSGYSERVADRQRDQIEYTDQDPWIRQKFEAELAQRGQRSLIPDEAYTNRSFEWQYSPQDE